VAYLFAVLRFFEAFFGTFLPLARASDKPIAIACLRLLTFFFDRPLRSVPALRFFIARSTFSAAPLEYFRFFAFLAIRHLPEDGRGEAHANDHPGQPTGAALVTVLLLSEPKRRSVKDVERQPADLVADLVGDEHGIVPVLQLRQPLQQAPRNRVGGIHRRDVVGEIEAAGIDDSLPVHEVEMVERHGHPQCDWSLL